MPTAYRLPPRPVHSTVSRNKAVDGLRNEFTHLSSVCPTGARVIYVTGLPGTGKKTVCYQYAKEFLKVEDGKHRIVSTWNLETPESLFRSICDLAVMMGAPQNTETVIRRKCQLMSKRIKTAKRIFESKKQGYKLLLILTNVGQQMQQLRQYWPQHGDEQWGDTQVLLCVDDVNELGLANSEINELGLNNGLIEEQALSLLQNLSGKEDDLEGAKYLLKELNYHPMSIAHCALFLRSVLMNPDNATFGWKDCLVRIEKLKMGTVGHYNTKQSLALTSILENNHAVSEMAVNRIGSINPYLESVFTFLAFCDKDDIFAVPMEVIVNFVMEGLRTEDDVDNCKMENSIRSTIRNCPLFLLPRSVINLRSVASRQLPPDTEGLFQSQLPPSSDTILPAIGDGLSLTGTQIRSPSPKEAVVEEELKEVVVKADTPTFSLPPTREGTATEGEGLVIQGEGLVIQGEGIVGEAITGDKSVPTGEKTPTEKPESREKTPAEKPESRKQTPAEKPESREKTPAQKPESREKTPAEKPESQEKTPAEKPESHEETLAEKPISREKTPAENPESREKTPAQKLESREKTPAEKPESREKTPAEKPESRKQTPAEKPESREKTPAEKPQSREKTPAEKPESREKTPAEKPESREKTPAENPESREKTPAEKPESREKTPATVPASGIYEGQGPTPTGDTASSKPASRETPVAMVQESSPAAAVTSRPATRESGAARPATRESADKSDKGDLEKPVGDKPSGDSRPATKGEDKPEGLEESAAPPSPVPGTTQEVPTEIIGPKDSEGKDVTADKGEFKPLHGTPPCSPPPTAVAGVFKPLMAEPPISGDVQVSGAIERPPIDGRSSSADRLVETSIYGSNLITGEIPIQREGSVVINIEDTIRAYEDEVEAITFNTSVHNAMRKFARNIVLRKVKGGQSSSSSAADTVSQQRKLQLEQFVKATKVLLMTYEKIYESKDPRDMAMKRMLGPQLQYFVNCMLTKFNFKNRVAVRALKFYADSLLLLGELVKADEALETAQNISYQVFSPTDLDLYGIIRDRATILARLGEKEETGKMLEECIRIVEQLEGDEMLETECQLLNELGQVHSTIGNLQYANQLIERSLGIKENLHGNNSLEIVDTLSKLAMLRHKMGQPKQALNQLERVMRIQERHDNPREKFSETLCNMAAVNATLGEHEKSKVLYQSVLTTQERTHGQWYPELATTLSNLAMVNMALGEFEEAKDALNRTKKIRGRVYGKNHPLVASTLTNLASVSYTMGELPEAMKLNEEALDIQKACYPETHPLIAVTMKNMAMIENSRGNLDKAKSIYERVLQIEEVIYGELHPAVASTLNNLADTVLEQGETAKAAVLFQRAMETNELVYGREHPDIARNLNNLGRAFKEMGDYDGAKTKLNASLQMKERRYGEMHINLVPTLMNLGDLYNLTKQPNKAKEVLTRGLKICEKKIGLKHPDSARLMRLLGNTFYLLGDLQTSEKLLNKSLDVLENVYSADHPFILATRADLGACSRPGATKVF